MVKKSYYQCNHPGLDVFNACPKETYTCCQSCESAGCDVRCNAESIVKCASFGHVKRVEIEVEEKEETETSSISIARIPCTIYGFKKTGILCTRKRNICLHDLPLSNLQNTDEYEELKNLIDGEKCVSIFVLPSCSGKFLQPFMVV